MSEGGAVLPAGVEEMPAGAALAAALEDVDPGRISPFDSVRLVRARRRQLSHEQAGFTAAVLQCALADPDAAGGRTETVGTYGADELRGVLHESASAVDRVLRLAEFAERWPIVSAAWDAGGLDQERVRILDSWTAALSDEHRGEVLRVVVPEAATLTLQGVMDRIEQVARDLDPEWARKRYDQHKAQRRVRARRTEAGTVNISGLDLGLDEGALAERHVAVLAGRAKALGHPGLLDTIEADVYVALLKPRPPWWSDDDVVASVVAAATGADPRDPRQAPDPDLAPPDGPIPGEQLDGDRTGGDSGDGDPDDGDVAGRGSATGTRPEDAPDPAGREGDGTPAPARRSGVRRTRRTRLLLRVGLLTLLGLDRNTARLPGYGVVHAELARKLCRDWADAEWRVALQDHTGALSAVLVSTRRPDGWATVPVNDDGTPVHPGTYHPATGGPEGSPAPPRPMVVIHATEDELDRLDAIALTDCLAEFPGWADWLTDLRRRHTFWHRTAGRRAAGHDPGLDARPDRGAASVPGAPDLGSRVNAPVDLGGLLADLMAEPAARFPTAAQRRWVSERNQTCTFPPCGADAVHAEIDHTRPAGVGGPTLTWNLGPACAHENQLKEQPGWWVEQPEPGHFVWHSNTGHAYPSTPTGPVPDHPPPQLFNRRSRSEPLEYAGNHGAWSNEPYPRAGDRVPPGRPPPEPRPPPDDEPPF